MKKSYNFKRSFIAIGLLLAIIMLPTISSARVLRDVLGDVNNNGKYDADDTRKILRQSTGLELKRTASDINMDGKVTAADGSMVLQLSTRRKVWKI